MNIKLVLSELKQYLSKKEYELFILYYEGYGMNDFIKLAKINRKDVFNEIIKLGRSLARFELFKCELVPNNLDLDYIKMFNECMNLIKKETECQTVVKRKHKKEEKK